MRPTRRSSLARRRLHGGAAISAWALAAVASITSAAQAEPQAPVAQPASAGKQPAAPQEAPVQQVDGRDVSQRGQLSTRFKIDPKNPEASVPTEKEKNDDPLEFGYFLQDLLDRAEAAEHLKQLDVVVSYYRAVSKAVPEMAKGWSKLCAAYENVHMRDKAVRACRYAIERPGSELGDFQRFVRLEIAKDGPLDPTETAEVAKVFAHLSATPQLALPLQRMICDVAVHNGDVKALEGCSAKLSELAPKDPTTVVYRWSLAMKKGQYREAKRLINEAKDLPIPPDGVKKMEKVTSDLRFAGWPKWVVPAALLAIVAAIAWRVRRNRLAVQS